MNQPADHSDLRTLGICLALTVLFGCATSTTVIPVSVTPPAAPPAAETPFVPPSPLGPVVAPGQVQELVPGGAIDWSGKTVWARGAGVVDPGNSSRDLAWQMALRAATVVAQRNLLEIVKGVRVDSDTRVQELVAGHDSVRLRVEAVVKGARQRGPARYDSLGGTVEIEMECDLYGEGGIESALAPQPVVGPQPENAAAAGLSPAAQQSLRHYACLVIDGGDTGLKPALFPKLCDDRGAILLDPRELAYAGATGAHTVQYVGALGQVAARPDFGQPMVFRVREARGELGTDPVLARADAAALREMADGLEFLVRTGRVLIKLAP
ncbi:hypothetical protein FJY68_03600 [candidate division WOR-3 bacterium]|uniref:LPP20 lipoprotein n=1 Tax=candidate division WOR-3 bacterium TaxID=2052148 RepID=A0A937XC20_UNCW3|nr:hypothetical protein [candidate division WOR-3 bacterium]